MVKKETIWIIVASLSVLAILFASGAFKGLYTGVPAECSTTQILDIDEIDVSYGDGFEEKIHITARPGGGGECATIAWDKEQLNDALNTGDSETEKYQATKDLPQMYLQIKELDIDGVVYPVTHKNISGKKVELRVDEALHEYEFYTLWMPLNQTNHHTYVHAKSEAQNDLLKQILIGNILSFYKSFDYMVDKQIMVKPKLIESTTQFKNQPMKAFKGYFITNAILPDHTGIGKAVSRGFGTVKKIS